MTFSIHICPVGFFPEPILNAVGALPVDRYYFLYNENEQCLEAMARIKSALLSIGQTDNIDVKIDPFDYASVVTTIMRIHHDEVRAHPDAQFYINFTSGTNIVAGACCSVSYFIGATLYYVMREDDVPRSKSEMVRIIKTPRIPDIEKMKPFAKDILLKICEKEYGIEMQALAHHMQSTPQKINHHINAFIDSGLIIKTKDGRNSVFIATEQGKLLSSWIIDN